MSKTKSIPVPDVHPGRPRKHAVDSLEVGESMVFKVNRGTIYGCIRYFIRPGGIGEGREFTILAESPKRTRVWRTA